jgi:hypothetical protein
MKNEEEIINRTFKSGKWSFFRSVNNSFRKPHPEDGALSRLHPGHMDCASQEKKPPYRVNVLLIL